VAQVICFRLISATAVPFQKLTQLEATWANIWRWAKTYGSFQVIGLL